MKRIGRTLAAAAVVAACAVTGLAGPAAAHPAHPGSELLVDRHRPDVRVPFLVKRNGEAVLDLRAAANGTDWATAGAESAVVSISVDGKYATDLVVSGAAPLARQLALGGVRPGIHVLRLHLATDRSPVAGATVRIDRLEVTTYDKRDPEYQVLRFAPIMYGRNIAELGSRFQSATTDVPLIAWHEFAPAATPGHTVLTYSLIWSNEDGGTNTPALMARWGRTTDIEWTYALELDEHGDRVPGSDTYQAANHETLHSAGVYEGDHPRLETCTSNNNMCDVVDDPMRFFLSTLQTLPAGQPREHLMDTNPWTYQIMSKEMIREGKIEAPGPATTATPEVNDQRNYLYAVVGKTTQGNNSGSSWVGVALGVRLKNGNAVYLSNHVDPTWSIQRDIPAATTIELPAGTTLDDIAAVSARRVVVGADTGAPVHVTSLGRGFLLGPDYLPGPSLLDWTGDIELTTAAPEAVVWSP
ncbi:hypothetical protein [Paractinoplanes globisporus]|uniref:Uncharacterized protein n=1 Tax=Paractinoplanes globisporus TaxID=113565 RepID=A0ABW6WSV5_9ACTN|nr:hypothetical protein [Actinoplanes globisporus]